MPGPTRPIPPGELTTIMTNEERAQLNRLANLSDLRVEQLESNINTIWSGSSPEQLTVSDVDLDQGTITVVASNSVPENQAVLTYSGTSNDLSGWSFYNANDAGLTFSKKFKMKKEIQFDLTKFEVVDRLTPTEWLNGGILALYEPDTKRLYLTHTSCSLEAITRNLKQIKQGVHPHFNDIHKVLVYEVFTSDDNKQRLLRLNEIVNEIKEDGIYKLVNKNDGLELKAYAKVTKLRPCLYLRNRSGDMILVGVFKHMDELIEFRDKYYPLDKPVTSLLTYWPSKKQCKEFETT